MNTLTKRNNVNGNAPVTTFSGMVDKLFPNNVNRFFDDDFWGFAGLERSVNVPVNVRETDKSFELEVVAPGHEKEDFKISLNGTTLTVSLDHTENHQSENKDEGWVRKEYKRKSFSRSFTLDDTIDANKISARYTGGILHLSLPKKESAMLQVRKIDIE